MMSKISEVSKRTGLSKRTLQYYDDEGLDDIDENNLSAADYAYYIEVQARITKKLSEVKM